MSDFFSSSITNIPASDTGRHYSASAYPRWARHGLIHIRASEEPRNCCLYLLGSILRKGSLYIFWVDLC